ncbi:MAG: hypothetical protein ACXVD0_01750 [Nocardioides sp.]
MADLGPRTHDDDTEALGALLRRLVTDAGGTLPPAQDGVDPGSEVVTGVLDALGERGWVSEEHFTTVVGILVHRLGGDVVLVDPYPWQKITLEVEDSGEQATRYRGVVRDDKDWASTADPAHQAFTEG